MGVGQLFLRYFRVTFKTDYFFRVYQILGIFFGIVRILLN